MGARGIIAGLATRAHAAAFLRGAMGSLVAVVGAVAIWRSLGSSIGIGGILQFIVILGFVYAMVFALIATDDVDRVIGRGLVAAGTLALPLAAHSHLRLGLLAGRPGAAGQVLEVNFFLAAGLILAATLLPLGLWLLRPTTGPRLEDSPDFEAGRPRLRGFNLFYRRQLADWLTEKDTARREQDRQFHDITLWGVPGLAVIGAVTLHFGWLGPRAGWLFLLWVVALLIAGSAAAALRWSPTKQDRVAFLAELCGFFGLRHLTETGMAISHPNEPAMYSLRHFQELGLLAKDRKSELKDVFLGRYEDKPAALAEALVERAPILGLFDLGLKQRHLLFTYPAPKRIAGRTVGLRDRGWYVNEILRSGIKLEEEPRQPPAIVRLFRGRLTLADFKPPPLFARSRHDPIRLENAAFERQFEVYATDPVEARYLLTPAFMERMTRLCDGLRPDERLQFAFANGRLWLAMPTPRDWFGLTPRGNLALTDPRFIVPAVDGVALIFEIVDTLKLGSEVKV